MLQPAPLLSGKRLQNRNGCQTFGYFAADRRPDHRPDGQLVHLQSLVGQGFGKKLTLIAAMKTNRVLYPDGHRCSAQDYASMLPNDQYHLVTVGGHEY